MPLSEELARFIASAEYRALPPEAVLQAKRAILDTLGVALAGCRQAGSRILAGQARPAGDAETSAAVLGWPLRAAPAEAALVNGAFAHALDYDDVSYSMRGHPSAPLLPAALAAAETAVAGGRDLILAFVLGVEVEGKLGRLMGGRHYALGWHPTSTLGTLGAAAAGARLLGLDRERTQAALGIAASMACGLRANFGTMTKPLHAGLAARNGLQAAQLAAEGFTAAAEALEGEEGFLAAFLGGQAPESPDLGPLGNPYEIVSPGLGQKLYPCCYATHRAVDAALELAQGIDAAEVAAVRARVSRGTLMPLLRGRPRTGLEGKFSLEYCLAAALLDGAVRIGSFSDEAVRRREAIRLMEATEVMEDETPLPNPLNSWAEVSLTLRDGGSRTLRVEVPKGDPRRPLAWQELAAKFEDCAGTVLSPDRVRRALDLLERLEELPDVRALTACLTPEEAPVP